MKAVVVGAGLAGCEAAYQLSRFNIPVTLIDMKPENRSPAHHSPYFAELVCSNSLKSSSLLNASGLLKEEMRIIGSLCMQAASQAQLPAGQALAVDREIFCQFITREIKNNKNIRTECACVSKIPEADAVIIATGPLTQGDLYHDIENFLQAGHLSFYDAVSPMIAADSLDEEIVFRQNRYDHDGADYVNCPMSREQYLQFYQAIVDAQKAPLHSFEKISLFEGCVPIEILAMRGEDTMRFGPMKPVGLKDPRTGAMPYACVQLRQEDAAKTLYSMVGFQTRLTFPEQLRVFRMIPGLQQAEFVRFGVMHRNTFIRSPGKINRSYQALDKDCVFFAGQITGVEGYVESMASGMAAGINAALYLKNAPVRFHPSPDTMSGALTKYICDVNQRNFQPMNANFGIINPLDHHVRNKSDKQALLSSRAIDEMKRIYLQIKDYMEFKNV